MYRTVSGSQPITTISAMSSGRNARRVTTPSVYSGAIVVTSDMVAALARGGDGFARGALAGYRSNVTLLRLRRRNVTLLQ